MDRDAFRLAEDTMSIALESGDPVLIANALSDFERGLLETMPDVQGMSERAARRMDRNHRRLFLDAVTRTVRAPIVSPDQPVATVGARPGAVPLLMPGNIEPSLSEEIFVRENVRLMEKLQGSIVDGMRQRIAEAQLEGTTGELLQRWRQGGMPARVGLSMTNVRAHAMLIADDQTGTMIGEMTRSRQASIGIEQFVWRSQGDVKVREQHQDWNGQVFTWASGADGTFPGQPINCRCWAQAIVDPAKVRASLTSLAAA